MKHTSVVLDDVSPMFREPIINHSQSGAAGLLNSTARFFLSVNSTFQLCVFQADELSAIIQCPKPEALHHTTSVSIVIYYYLLLSVCSYIPEGFTNEDKLYYYFLSFSLVLHSTSISTNSRGLEISKVSVSGMVTIGTQKQSTSWSDIQH